VFRVTESPSITDTESPNTPDEHEQNQIKTLIGLQTLKTVLV